MIWYYFLCFSFCALSWRLELAEFVSGRSHRNALCRGLACHQFAVLRPKLPRASRQCGANISWCSWWMAQQRILALQWLSLLTRAWNMHLRRTSTYAYAPFSVVVLQCMNVLDNHVVLIYMGSFDSFDLICQLSQEPCVIWMVCESPEGAVTVETCWNRHGAGNLSACRRRVCTCARSSTWKF